MTQSQFTLGGSGESGGNESDNSTEAESLPQRTETFRRPVSGVHHPKPKDEVALRKSRDLSAHRSSISGKFFLLENHHILENCL